MLLHRAFPAPFDALQAASVLDLDVERTRRLLAALADGGWLARVRRGWYTGVPIDASEPGNWREDPWVVAATLFSPGYIGGWSAVEHWGLTDQIFSVVYVVVGRKVAPTRQTVQGFDFLIRTVPERMLFGIRRVWRKSVPVNVSDPHRTVIDILNVPAAAGGVLHTAEVLRTYFESAHLDQEKLLEYGDRLGRGTVFKRLGYLAEQMDIADDEFLEACRSRITKGVSQLDPGGSPKGRIVARWNLRVNTWRLAPDSGDGP
ncbi:MAG: hypothetical protein OXI80_15265 [Caldilineaceae bacterium]|nr:hypothetical protein [Caldilineaceae bacterium]MDE0339029.1 hypothetical protein [Caldilineaceae bacterium]